MPFLFSDSGIKLILLITAVSVVIGGYFFIKRTGYKACQQDVIVKTVTITEKRNEIANKRPDTRAFLNELLTSDNW